ncbi:MAG: PAS domain-containing protein, partial [Anaerolineales bacterium]
MPTKKNLLNPLEDDFPELKPGGPNGGSAAASQPAPRVSGPLSAADARPGIVPGWTWETDAQGRYLFCAPEIRTLLGIEPAGLVGQPVAEIGLPTDAAGRRDLTSALNSQRPLFDLRLQARTASGAMRVVVLNALPLFDPDDQFLGYRGVAHVLLHTGELSSVTHPSAEAPALASATTQPPAETIAVAPPPAVKAPAPSAAADDTMPPPATPKGTASLPPPPAPARVPGVTGPLISRQPPTLRPAPSETGALAVTSGLPPIFPPAGRPPGPAQTIWAYLADVSGVTPQSSTLIGTAPELEAAITSGARVVSPSPEPAAETAEAPPASAARRAL